MKKVVFICCMVLSAMLVKAQSWNPYVKQAIVSPAPLLPLEFNGTGVLSFDVGNTGGDPLPLTTNQEMGLEISLSKGVPNAASPLDALGGSMLGYFSWLYDAVNNTFRAKQIMTIPGNSLGNITIQYKVTSNTNKDNSSNGFNVNLQPPPYTNGVNTTDDDAVSSYTYVQALDFDTFRSQLPEKIKA